MRDIAKLFPEGKRLGTKSSDLVSGTALTRCLDIHEAFEVLGTPAEQRVAILASTVFGADTPHGAVVKQAISGAIRKHKETVPLPEIPPPNMSVSGYRRRYGVNQFLLQNTFVVGLAQPLAGELGPYYFT